MSDVLGNALQKLTERKNPSPEAAPQNRETEPCTESVEQQSISAVSGNLLGEPEKFTPEALADTDSIPATAQVDVTSMSPEEVKLTEAVSSVPKRFAGTYRILTQVGAFRDRLFSATPERRRQLAAALVLAAMAFLWLNDSTGSRPERGSAEAPDMESILSEFDSADLELPEPAEPFESASDALMIPQSESVAGYSVPSASGQPAAGDVTTSTGVESSGVLYGGGLMMPDAPSLSAESNTNHQKVRVRLTKSITPLN